MKRSGRWALSLALIGLLVVIGWRAVVNLQHKKQAPNHAAVPQELPIQLAAQEVLTVQPLQLALSVPLNGVVQAVNSAVVKAYVAGELRGLSLAELLNMNVDAISAVLPRVTQPMLHKHDVAQLEPADLVGLSVAVVGFLLPKDQQAPSP